MKHWKNEVSRDRPVEPPPLTNSAVLLDALREAVRYGRRYKLKGKLLPPGCVPPSVFVDEGIHRYGAVIHDLRMNKGHVIETTLEPFLNRFGNRGTIGVYRLEEKMVDAIRQVIDKSGKWNIVDEKGVLMCVPGLEGFDFVMTHPEYSERYFFLERKTGLAVGTGESFHEAWEQAWNKLSQKGARYKFREVCLTKAEELKGKLKTHPLGYW